VNGLNAAPKYRGEFTPTAPVARSINASQTNCGQRRCQTVSSATANDSSRMPRAVTTEPQRQRRGRYRGSSRFHRRFG
jgi:hypothetical protein